MGNNFYTLHFINSLNYLIQKLFVKKKKKKLDESDCNTKMSNCRVKIRWVPQLISRTHLYQTHTIDT